jgi:hypothetical protein
LSESREKGEGRREKGEGRREFLEDQEIES